VTPVERQSSAWNSGAKKLLLIHDGGGHSPISPPLATHLKEKLTVQRKSPQPINVAILYLIGYTLQNETLSYSRYTTTPKRAKFHTQKNRSLLVHIVELSTTAVAKVDIKVINASLNQNQCLQCVTPPLTHVEIPRLRNATELNNDGMIKFVDVHAQPKRTKFITFSERDLINDDSSVCSPILSAIDLQCHVFFPFEKLLSNVRLCR